MAGEAGAPALLQPVPDFSGPSAPNRWVSAVALVATAIAFAGIGYWLFVG